MLLKKLFSKLPPPIAHKAKKCIKIKDFGKNNIISIPQNIAASSRINITIYGDNNKIIINSCENLHINLSVGLSNSLVKNCLFEVGENTSCVGMEVMIAEDDSQVTIGRDCILSSGIVIWCTDTHSILDENGNLLNKGRFIKIGDHVWISRDVYINKNSSIPNGCIIGWRSNVTKVFEEENTVIAGNPAVVKKHNIKWDITRPNNYTKG